jgi:chromosome segregation ATPase
LSSVVRRSSFVVRPSSVVRRSPFIVNPKSEIARGDYMTHELLRNEKENPQVHQHTTSNEADAAALGPHTPILKSTSIFALQRSIGNTAVQKLLRAPAQPTNAIQRAPDTQTNEQAQTSQGYVTIPDLRVGAVHLGPALRSRMIEVGQKAQAARTTRSELSGLVEYLKMAADVSGSADVQAISAVDSSARKLTGAKRASFEASIDRFRISKNVLKTMMIDVEAARKDIVESTKTLELKVLGKKKIDTQREKEKQESNLQDLEAKRDSANKILKGFIDFSGMLINPAAGWSKALVSAAAMVGNHIQDITLGGTYAQQIAAVRAKINDLTQSIKSIEDAQALVEIEAATAKLQSAQLKLESRLNALAGAVNETEVAQDDLQRELRKLGKRGGGAADALTAGSNVIEIGNEAITKSLSQQQSLEALKARIAETSKQIEYYIRMLEHENSNLTVQERSLAREAAIQNIRAARSWDSWVTAELKHLAEEQKFLQSRSYQTSYTDGIDQALEDMRLTKKPRLQVL